MQTKQKFVAALAVLVALLIALAYARQLFNEDVFDNEEDNYASAQQLFDEQPQDAAADDVAMNAQVASYPYQDDQALVNDYWDEAEEEEESAMALAAFSKIATSKIILMHFETVNAKITLITLLYDGMPNIGNPNRLRYGISISMVKEECITMVYGRADPSIMYIVFVNNLGKAIGQPIGNPHEGTRYFIEAAPPGQCLTGLYGNATTYIDDLKFVWGPEPTVTKFITQPTLGIEEFALLGAQGTTPATTTPTTIPFATEVDVFKPITNIRVYSKVNAVYGIQVRRAGEEWGELQGSIKGNTYEFDIDNDECITSMQAQYAAGSATGITSLTLRTNKKKIFGPFGDSGGTEIQAKPFSCVMGFYGSFKIAKQGGNLFSIGIRASTLNILPRLAFYVVSCPQESFKHQPCNLEKPAFSFCPKYLFNGKEAFVKQTAEYCMTCTNGTRSATTPLGYCDVNEPPTCPYENAYRVTSTNKCKSSVTGKILGTVTCPPNQALRADYSMCDGTIEATAEKVIGLNYW